MGCEFVCDGERCGWSLWRQFEDRRMCDEHILVVQQQRRRLERLYEHGSRRPHPAALHATILSLERDLAEIVNGRG